MSPQTSTVSLYPPGGFGAPKDRHGHADGTDVGLPAGTEVFSADNHISLADDIFYERFPDDLKDAGAADLVRGRRVPWSARKGKSFLPRRVQRRADAVRRPGRCGHQQHRGPDPRARARTASTRNWPSPTPSWRCSATRTRQLRERVLPHLQRVHRRAAGAVERPLLRCRADQLVGPEGRPADAGRAEVARPQDVPDAAQPGQGRRRQRRSTTAAPR